ncbi:MAG: MFS transporter [Gammaproteobacteria bacterium]|nr:MFS transporter [Gammaproteobacteria bacterium]
MTKTELKTSILLAGIYVSRMLGLFLIFPTFSFLAKDLDSATPLKIGLALGIYSLAQATLQIPAGILSDVIGRKKVLFGGLGLFFIGSVIASMADDIDTLIIARLIQGAGAVSAVCLAYVADSIRPSEQSKTMAIIGVSIALSFLLSFVLGSMIGGLTGIFILMSCLSVFALIFAYALPAPNQQLSIFKMSEFKAVAKDMNLLLVNLQVAFLHMTLSASFYLIPILLERQLPNVDRMILYIPSIIGAFILVMPIIRKTKDNVGVRLPAFWACFAIAIFLFAATPAFNHVWLFSIILGLFFFAFTFIEAALPTRLFQLTRSTSRGATSGIFSVYQFSGNFLGGLLGAKIYTTLANNGTIEYSFYILAIPALCAAAATFFTKSQQTRVHHG